MLTAVTVRTESTESLLGSLNDFERKNAPKTLYVVGDVNLLKLPSVSIVGSREASPDALKRAHKLCRLLAEDQIVIVSGLARGIDAMAHNTAMEVGGKTIAVLGTPVDEYYPSEHKDLQDTIMSKHLVLSQFAPGSPTRRTNFPQRNRTMALISDATVIVEAGESSGTLSQGWEALRLGRPLFIMQSVVKSGRYQWVKEMIDYGARSLNNVSDVLEVIPPVMTEQDYVAAAAF
ncbi:MAG: DNA-protecting protein DprA [Myxococcales bacterium]|nr:MAG: DNA-protecting protein DprA [Myxococcales bacterium]